MVRSSGHGHQQGPVLQKHFTLTHIAPDPKCCQVHRQVVLLGLKNKDAVINGLFDTHGISIATIQAEAVRHKRGFYLCMLGAVIREGLSTANVLTVILWSRKIGGWGEENLTAVIIQVSYNVSD